MRKFQVIMQDEYNNLYNLGFYDSLDDSIEDINKWLEPYETTIDSLETYVSSFNITFDKEIETKDGNIVMVRGFTLYEFSTMVKHYTDERINECIEKMFECGIKDEEFKERFITGEDFIILTNNIEKIINYVNSDYEGELYLNSNIYYICYDCLAKVLELYGLKLIGEQKVTENEKVVRIDENVSN